MTDKSFTKKYAESFVGAATTVILGAVLKVAFDFIGEKYTAAKRRTYASFEASTLNGASAYFIVLERWVMSSGILKDNKHFVCDVKWSNSQRSLDGLSVAPGTYRGVYKGVRIIVTKTKIEKDDYHGSQIAVSLHGDKDRKVYNEIRNKLLAISDDGKLSIERSNSHSSMYRSKRSMDSVIVSDETKTTLKDHLDWWVGAKEDFVEIGIPYKTAILLQGPPGTGKSSMALAIASYLDFSVYFVTPDSVKYSSNITDDISPNSVVVIEDFDRFFTEPVKEDDSEVEVSVNGSKVSSSKDAALTQSEWIQFLLSFLDGLASPENVVFVVTTNFPENLDPVLLRPGRIDLTIDMPAFDKNDAMKMLKLYGFDEAAIDSIPEVAWRQPSALQTHILKMKRDLRNAKA